MKVLKNTEQKNFRIDTTCYRPFELEELEAHGIIDRPHYKMFVESKDWKMASEYRNHYVVFTSDCTDVKVRYNKDTGMYETVAITLTGHTLNVIV